eukprot:TRINITY_DN4793_c1_g2_i1.p1 TRINITY_DN4793_c1_g2~~TRINITY_DN4793_c1_g2_i1.p1  ORF type:complete len:359 (+),score=74.05 TRINITY_DN4793_c1_g2_i1:55-1131(+)
MGKNKPKAKASEKQEDAPLKAESNSAPQQQQQQQRRRRKRKCCRCPEWLPWVIMSMLIMGVLPAVVFALPVLVPPVKEADGRFTMVGGGGFEGVRGLWSVLNKFGTRYCAEQGAKDTIKCHMSVMEMSLEILRAPGLVDFYTAMPQTALNEENFAAYKGAVSPLRIDQQWEEFTVDPSGANPSQVAKIVLDMASVSKTRHAPIASKNSPFSQKITTLTDTVGFVKCQDEFSKVFGKDRSDLFVSGGVAQSGKVSEETRAAHDSRTASLLWSDKRKTIYAFGLEAAIAITRSIPSDLSDATPVNIVILPLADGANQWYLHTRGRETCEPEAFRKIYENTFQYFAWVIRGANQKLQVLSK